MNTIYLHHASQFLMDALRDGEPAETNDITLDGEAGEDRLLRELLVARYHRGGLPAIASMLNWSWETISAFHKYTLEDEERLQSVIRTLRDRDQKKP